MRGELVVVRFSLAVPVPVIPVPVASASSPRFFNFGGSKRAVHSLAAVGRISRPYSLPKASIFLLGIKGLGLNSFSLFLMPRGSKSFC
jgi:hypothetical protein